VSNLYLVGFMGAGKSEVGQLVAQLMDRRFVDLDEAVEAQFDLPIPEIFASSGESAFREAETEELRRTTSSCDLVVATGGGAFSTPGNRRLIRDTGGVSVYLDAPWELILERLGGDHGGRPKWIDDDRAYELYRRRLADYRSATLHIRLAPRDSAEEVAGRIVEALREIPCAS
jgi:shikimate kinase